MSLSLITDKHTISSAVKRLRNSFRQQGTVHKRSPGFRGGQIATDVLAVEAAGIWFAHALLATRHWCAFGTLPLPEHGNLNIAVEINPPLEGVDGRVAGMVACDEQGALYLCHDGAIGGGRQGIGRGEFLKWLGQSRVAVISPTGRSVLVFVVAQIGSPRLVQQAATYVRAVADFKAGHPAPSTTQDLCGGSDKESEKPRNVPARDGYTAGCDHGIIRNRLAELIEASGRKVTRDQQRDLVVKGPQKPSCELEIKTSADPQCVYTAVGQLLVHNTVQPVTRRVAVLPADVTQPMRKAIAALGIDLVTYRWTKQHIKFVGLQDVLPGVGDTAEISRTHP